MYKNKKILALIPARGETKHIYKKNTKLFNDKPLFTWVLNSAIKSKLIDKVIISTEDREIIEIANTYGDYILKRPEELSKENISISQVIKYNIEELKKEGLEFDYILTLLPTQPLIETFHLDNSIREIIDNNYPSLIGVTKIENNFLRTLDTSLESFNTPLYKVNNSIFINPTTDKEFNIYTNLKPFIIDSKYDGNIDPPVDWEICELRKLLIELERI